MKKILLVAAIFMSGIFYSEMVNAQSYCIRLYSGTNLTSDNNAAAGAFGTFNAVAGISVPFTEAYYYMPASAVWRLGDYQANPLSPGSSSLNDRAKSAEIWADRRMRFILYDSASGSTSDDYQVITVKRPVSGLRIEWVDYSFESDDVKIEYFSNNGILGKISSIRVDVL